jgi:hypothetical protein
MFLIFFLYRVRKAKDINYIRPNSEDFALCNMLKSKFKVRQDVDMVERSENEDKASLSLVNALIPIGTFCVFVPKEC